MSGEEIDLDFMTNGGKVNSISGDGKIDLTVDSEKLELIYLNISPIR